MISFRLIGARKICNGIFQRVTPRRGRAQGHEFSMYCQCIINAIPRDNPPPSAQCFAAKRRSVNSSYKIGNVRPADRPSVQPNFPHGKCLFSDARFGVPSRFWTPKVTLYLRVWSFFDPQNGSLLAGLVVL